MTRISLDEFKKDCKLKRKEHFDSPFGLAYKKYTDLGYDKKDSTYFFEHASDYVENMRKNCWDEFVPLEKEFTTEMLSCFIEEDRVRNMTPVDALKDFITEYAEHIYALALSNTQSRRSRAGKEFEAIIELLLIGADIPSDTQSAIGKEYFRNNQIGKLIDFVVPSVTGFLINKHDAMVISAKTSLRERWQEVPEELSRTGMCEVFLATVDEEISEDTLHIMYEANVRVVTTKSNKEKIILTIIE